MDHSVEQMKNRFAPAFGHVIKNENLSIGIHEWQ